jgi:hypothetical protein
VVALPSGLLCASPCLAETAPARAGDQSTFGREQAGMQVLYERCTAVDIGKDVIAVAVRLPGDGPDGRQTVKRTFKTFYGVLAEAARWLTSLRVTHVAMQATGICALGRCWRMYCSADARSTSERIIGGRYELA